MRNTVLKLLFLACAVCGMSFVSVAATVEIGNGNRKTEVLPILNWWLGSYQGNEVIYLQEELGLKPGDQITALSYHCIKGSAYGGNFNVRIKNTALTALYDGTEDPLDPSVQKVNYNDKVNGNCTLGPYSAGDWITFELGEPFVYSGENIIVDIRNTAPGNYKGWCYFASTTCQPHRSLAWRNAKDEKVSGFNVAYDPYGDYDYGFYIYEDSPYDTEGDYPNVRITYEHPPLFGDLNRDGVVDVGDVSIAINVILGKDDPRATYEQCDLNGDGIADVLDVSLIIDIILGN